MPTKKASIESQIKAISDKNQSEIQSLFEKDSAKLIELFESQPGALAQLLVGASQNHMSGKLSKAEVRAIATTFASLPKLSSRLISGMGA